MNQKSELEFFNEQKHWEVRGVIDRDSGKHRNEYYFKRKKAFRVPLTSKLASALGGYALIEKDLRSISEWLSLIESMQTRSKLPNDPGHYLLRDDHDSDHIIKGLFISCVIFYGKCFSACEGRKVKLERSNIDESDAETHDSIIELRNTYAAHSGKGRAEEVNVVLVLNPKKKYFNNKPILIRELMQTEVMYTITQDIVSFRRLVGNIRNTVLDKLETLDSLIYKNEISPEGNEYWYKKAKAIT